MVLSTKIFSFFLVLLISSFQIQARDSHFFSKLTRDTNASNNEEKENNLMNKEKVEDAIEVSQNKLPASLREQEENPSFTQENHNGHGLYRHGSGQFPPSTTTTTNNNNNNNEALEYYNWNGERQGMSDTRFLENGRYYYYGGNHNEYYYGNSGLYDYSMNNKDHQVNNGNNAMSFDGQSNYHMNEGINTNNIDKDGNLLGEFTP